MLTPERHTDQAFCELVDRERGGLFAVATMVLGDRAVAEEVVQDVLERTYRRWSHVSSLDRPGAWVRRAVINQSISATRRAGAERRALDRIGSRRVPQPSEFAEPSESAGPGSEIWAAVRSLPVNQRTAVALHYGADLSIASIATELDLTEAAVKTLLHRARTALRAHETFEEMAT